MTVTLALLLAVACIRHPGPPPRPPTDAEAALVDALNELRVAPRPYAGRLQALQGCFDGLLLRIPGRVPLRTREGKAVVDEAIDWLARVPPARRLKIDPALCAAARDHARDLGITGRRSHEGSDGSDLGIRLKRHGRLVGVAGEAIAFGNIDPAEVIQQLVVDDGIADRGHRLTLMDDAYRLVGVACAAHRTDEFVCVLDFAQEML